MTKKLTAFATMLACFGFMIIACARQGDEAKTNPPAATQTDTNPSAFRPQANDIFPETFPSAPPAEAFQTENPVTTEDLWAEINKDESEKQAQAEQAPAASIPTGTEPAPAPVPARESERPKVAKHKQGKALLFSLANSEDSDVGQIRLLTDSKGRITGVSYKASENSAPILLPMNRLASKEGGTLAEEKGIRGLILKMKVNEKAGKGTFTVKYVHDGMSAYMAMMEETRERFYRECQANMIRSKSGEWKVVRSGHVIKQGRIMENSSGTGIDTIAGLCK